MPEFVKISKYCSTGRISQDVSSQSKSFHFFLNGESDQSESCIFLILLLLLPFGFESSASTAVLPTTLPASPNKLDGTGGTRTNNVLL